MTEIAVPELSRRPTIGHRVEYALFSAAAVLLDALPRKVALAAGARIGRLGYAPFHIRRSVVRENLRTAFPDRDSDWIDATARAAYAHVGRETVEVLRAAREGATTQLARTVLEGEDILRNALERGRGAILLTGHFGNWELAVAAVTARGTATDVLIQRQRNPLFDEAIIDARHGLGMDLIDRGLATRTGLRSLRENRVLAIAGDQNTRRGGVFVPFFGRPASTSRGFAILAARSRAPILTIMGTRRPDGRLHVRIRMLADEIGRDDDATDRVLRDYLRTLEDTIRDAPEQYFWHHRRWKTRPPEEPVKADPV
ncbi:MAG: lysophospholipid acyltransferase family protein [Longimicrobiales bacterium]